MIGFNNSRFDNFILLENIFNYDMLNDVIICNNKILNIKFGGRNLTYDLCFILNCSLKNACESF